MTSTLRNLTSASTLVASMTLVAGILSAAPARAQLNGENLLGDMGVKSGSQPEPGLYVSSIYYRYRADSLRGPDGKRMSLDPTGEAQQTIHAAMPLVLYVTPKKVLGAHF